MLLGEADERVEHRPDALVGDQVADEQQPRAASVRRWANRWARRSSLSTAPATTSIRSGSSSRRTRVSSAMLRLAASRPSALSTRAVLHERADAQQRVLRRRPADLLGEHAERAVQVHDDGGRVALRTVEQVGESLGRVVGEVDDVERATRGEMAQRSEHGPRVAEPVALGGVDAGTPRPAGAARGPARRPPRGWPRPARRACSPRRPSAPRLRDPAPAAHAP